MGKSKFRSRYLFIALPCLSVLAVAVTSGISKQTPAPASSLRVQNKTESLEVVNISQQDTLCMLTLRNVSPKAINGYSIGRSSNSKLDVDLTIGDTTIAPGEEFKESIPISQSQGPPVINVLAVMFTDGTADGEAQVIAANQERRKGTRQELAHILPILRGALNSSAPGELSTLKIKVASLPEETASEVSPQVKNGRLRARQDIISKVEMMKQGDASAREELRALIKDIEERISRL